MFISTKISFFDYRQPRRFAEIDNSEELIRTLIVLRTDFRYKRNGRK